MDPQACYENWLDAEGDFQQRAVLRDAYNRWVRGGGFRAVDEAGTAVDSLPIDDVEGQDRARGILAVNPHAEGSEEWHAWALGYDYAKATGGVHENPLSGEWADQMTPQQLHAQLTVIRGYELGDAAFDEVDDAFELGYVTYVAGWRL